MKIHNLIQGSPEWLAYRAQHFNASDAPAMMGCSPYKTRAELLRELHTGVVGDVDIATQKRFDNGHRVEALARPLAEEFIGAELYPVTGSNGRLSASFDGLTMDENEGFEHKALNAELRAVFKAMAGVDWSSDADAGRTLPLMYRVQMEQQLMVSGAERVLFMSSAWTGDSLDEEHHCWYYLDATLRGEILLGWDQFERDLAAYAPQPRPEKVEAQPVENLPAVAVRMDGALVVQSNLPAFGLALREFVDRVPKRPSTDLEFAQTEAACKSLKRAEEALDAAEANALASLSDVEAMRRMVKDFRDLARATRLASEKMVDRRKLEIREEAVAAARKALDLHIAVVNAEIAPMRLQPVPADFAGAIKGKRSLESMQDALDTTLAGAKIAADTQGRAIRKNIEHFNEVTNIGTQALFADLGQLVHKAPDDFRDLVQARVLAQQERDRKAEEVRQAAEAQRIAAAEQRAREQEAARIADQQRQQAEEVRQAAEAQRIAAAEQRAREQEAARIADQQRQQAEEVRQAAEVAAKVVQQAAAPAPAPMAAAPAQAVSAPAAAPAMAPRADEPATLNLGTICGRLGFIVRAEFLADTLHIRPAKVDGNRPGLYTESQFATICRQLQSHVGAMAELYAGEVA